MILVLSLVACSATMLSSLLLAYGRLRPVYALGLLNGACYVLLNSLVGLSSPEQRGLLFLVLPSAWGMLTSLLGLRRLARLRPQAATALRPVPQAPPTTTPVHP